MSPERWQRVKEVFHTAAELDGADRSHYLDTACADDPEVRIEVETLLLEDSAPADVFAGPVFEVAAEVLLETRRDGFAGRRVDRYRILSEIGRGGMGAVYLAVRDDDQYRQQVAIKLVKRGMDTDFVLERFRQERQILASLNHPNIARLLDGGVTEDGLSYFVMEHVEGVPIDDFCAHQALPLKERIELFRTVCGAVQYAHQNLVVHRDLKPSNILVTAEGVPKLLDFGIAKLLDPEHLAGATATTPEAMLMTLAYASPEQVRGQSITTASDVYALGVLLYELLTGLRPYAGDRPRLELARVICDQDPLRPSTAVRRQTPETTVVPGASEERTEDQRRRKLSRRLAGDLDNIIQKAMQKAPERRYASAEQLAEDLRRHLQGLPVLARPDTLTYRTGKFVRRHRVGVSAAALIVVSLVAGILSTTWQARVAEARRLEAEAQRATAEEVSSFLTDIFETSDPNQKPEDGSTVTARALLDRAAQKIHDDLRDQPEVRARLLSVMGTAYNKLGLYQEASSLLENALTLRQQVFGEEHPAVAASLHQLGEQRRLEGDYAAAEAYNRRALALRQRLFHGDHADLAASLNNLAQVRARQGDPAEAESLYRQALDMKRRLHHGKAHEEVAASLNNLAELLRARNDYAGAEPLYREALDIYLARYGERHTMTAGTLRNLAILAKEKGDYAAAEADYRKALKLQRELLGDVHPEVVITVNNLAELRRVQGDYVAAEDLHRQALAANQALHQAAHPDLAMSLANLATTLYDQGKHTEAEPLYRQALEQNRKVYGDDHLAVAHSLLVLGRLLTVIDRAGEAEPLLRRSLEIRRQELPAGDWRIASAESVLGGCLTALGRGEEAEPLLRSGYETLVAKRGPADRQTEDAARRLAEFEAAGLPTPGRGGRH